MSLAIAGVGLATPFGLTPRQHVLFRRADVPGPAASPFLLPDDRRLRAFHCSWLDAALPLEQRMAWLANAALVEAVRPIDAAGYPVSLALVLPGPRPGLDDEAIGRIAGAIQAERRFSAVRTHRGEAGAIAALAEALTAPDRDDPPAVVLAVDSFIDLAWLTHHAANPRTRWEAPRPTPSEGAAAIVVLPSSRAGQLGLRPIGTVNAAATGMGSARDDNDEPVDAAVMTGLIERVAPPRVYYAFGQDTLDPLRNQDWQRAIARHVDRFWDCQNIAIETKLGALGAASSAASVAYGLFTLRLHAEPERLPRDAPFVAWALSRDGTRGLASVSVTGA